MTEPNPQTERLILDREGSYDIAEADYHADPCPEPSLSSSIAKVLLARSPRHAREAHPRLNPNYEAKVSDTFDAGSVFHKLILGKGPELAILPFGDYKTNAAKEAKAAARAAGQLPVLEKNLPGVDAMVSAVRAQVSGWQELAYAMAGGQPETTLTWQEETPVGPIWCRAMLDWKPTNGNLVVDWKTCQQGAGPEEWGARTAWQNDVDVQDAFYRRGIRKVLGLPDPALLFAVAELAAPYSLACHRITPAAAAMADRQVQYAINVWGLCLAADRWPGYRRETAWIEPPPWRETRWLAREERGETEPTAALAMLQGLDQERPALTTKAEDADPNCPFGLPAIEGQTHDA